MFNILRKQKKELIEQRHPAPSQQAKSYKLPAASFGLVEVVVGVSILGAGFGILFGVAFAAVRLASDASTKIQSSLLLEEGVEGIRALRASDNGWTSLTNILSSTKCLQFSSGSYSVATAPVFSSVKTQRSFVEQIIPTALAQAEIDTSFSSTDFRMTYHNGALDYGSARSGSGNGATQFSMQIADQQGSPYVKRVLVQFDTTVLPVEAQIIDAKLIFTTGSISSGSPVLAVTKLLPTGSFFISADFSKWEALDSPPVYTTQILLPNAINTIDLPNTAVVVGDYTRFMLRLESELDAIAPVSNYSISLPSTPSPSLQVKYVIDSLTSLPANCPALATSDPNDIEIYRTVSVYPVCRDETSGNIEATGPYECDETYTTNPKYDPNTIFVSVRTYWNQRGIIKRDILETYLTNR